MKQIVAHSSIPLQSQVFDRLVVPNIAVFGPAVYLMEALIGISLMLGIFTRLFALVGLLMALNLWIGLYSAPGEWPWTYGYLIVIQALFVIDPPGRCLGLERQPPDDPDCRRSRLRVMSE
jgi:thiosulfate dehydrogenase [quinone] large subunit